MPLGLVSIASYLQAHGHEAELVERSVTKGNVAAAVKKFQPDVIGISTLSYLSCIDAKKVTEKLRKITDVPIVWGGSASSSSPELILREAHPDYIILGEGEITWLDLVNALENGIEDVSGINGLAYLSDNGSFVQTPTRAVADLTGFPDIDWSLIEPKRYYSSFFNCTKMFYLHASKGCPASCTFCSNKQFHQGINRCRDPKQVMRDIDYLVTECGANGIYFSDELFVPKRTVREELCHLLIERKYDLVWGCQMRLGVLNKDDIKLMYEAGCRWILFGIESGNKERIQSIKKNIDIDLAKQTIEWCESIGITVQASFIIGFPGETPEEMKKTVAFAQDLHAGLTVMNILMPVPNSEIFNELQQNHPQFRIPDSIKKIARGIEQKAPDDVIYNVSDIPTRDLRVVHYYYQWIDFIGAKNVKGDSFGVIKKLARDTFNRIFMHGISGLFFGTFISAKQFLTVFFYSHFFPGIKKKYGLKR